MAIHGAVQGYFIMATDRQNRLLISCLHIYIHVYTCILIVVIDCNSITSGRYGGHMEALILCCDL